MLLARLLRFLPLAALLILFGLGALLHQALQRFERTERSVEQSREVIDEIQKARVAALRSGLWLRNYTVTSSPEMLSRVRRSTGEGLEAVQRLVPLTQDHPAQNLHAHALVREMGELLEVYRSGADFAAEQGVQALETVLNSGVQVDHTRRVRERLETMEALERQRLEGQSRLEARHLLHLKGLLILLGTLATAILLWPLWRFVPAFGMEGRAVGRLGTSLDASRLFQLRRMLSHRQFHQQLARLVQRVVHRRTKAAVLVFDLDDFRLLNERHGRAVGDHVLKIMSERVRQQCRSQDLVARLGGDEFVVALGSVASRDAATAAAQRIQQRLLQPIELDGTSFQIGSSIGIAMVPEDGQDPEGLLQVADAGLYQAKRSGKARVAFGVMKAN